jgi:hypothetical protein
LASRGIPTIGSRHYAMLLHLYNSVYIYIYTHTCIYNGIYIYIHIYTHT